MGNVIVLSLTAADSKVDLPGAATNIARSYAAAAAQVLSHRVHSAEFKAEAVARIQSELKLQAIVKDMDFQLSNASLMLLPEYGFKLKVLKELQFVSADEVRCGAIDALL